MKRLSRSWGNGAACRERTDGQSRGARDEQREDAYDEFCQHESNTYPPRQVQPDPLELKVRLWRPTLSCGNTFGFFLRHLIPQLHAFAPTSASYTTYEKTPTRSEREYSICSLQDRYETLLFFRIRRRRW